MKVVGITRFSLLLDMYVYMCVYVVIFFYCVFYYFFLQPTIGTAHSGIVEPVLNLLKTLHLEVQYEGWYACRPTLEM